jgi:DNA sulfur modification protein DndD
VGNLNTSLVSSLKLSIILAIVSANKTRNDAAFYPLIADAPVSDFDVVKATTFFKETANTFRQSIVIVKEYLLEDPARPNRYKPDSARLGDLKTDLEAAGKTLTVYQLDMPDGVSNLFRAELEISIQNVNC